MLTQTHTATPHKHTQTYRYIHTYTTEKEGTGGLQVTYTLRDIHTVHAITHREIHRCTSQTRQHYIPQHNTAQNNT